MKSIKRFFCVRGTAGADVVYKVEGSAEEICNKLSRYDLEKIRNFAKRAKIGDKIFLTEDGGYNDGMYQILIFRSR